MTVKLKGLWRSLSIRNKQLIFFAVLLVAVAAINIYFLNTLYKYLDEFQNALSRYHGINRYLVELKSLRRGLARQLREGTTDNLRAFMSSKEELAVLLDRVRREAVQGKESYFLLQALTNGQGVYLEKCLAAIEARQQGLGTYYLPFYTAERIADYLEGYITQLLNVQLTGDHLYFRNLEARVAFARYLTFFGLLCLSLVCFAFAVLFSDSLTRPIRKLASASLHMANGDLDVPPIAVESKDEIGTLANSFNVMSSGIKRMVLDLKEKAVLERKLHEEELANIDMQRALREAQFLSLQAQINPHFLFNTLNTISRTAVLERAEDTAKLIKALSDLFRYNLHGSGKSVKLKEELHVVEEYLRIQFFRFGDRIRSEVLCSVDPERVEIPSFTLQPLVENSVLHGLEPKETGGRLRIKITAWKGRLRLRILDTGVGIAAERMKDILIPRDDLFHGGASMIGLLNVSARLKLFFNGEESFRLQSKPGRGTLVSISFPLRGGAGV